MSRTYFVYKVCTFTRYLSTVTRDSVTIQSVCSAVMNLITRTHNNKNYTTDVRKSQRVVKTPKFLKEYVTDDYEDNVQHPADSSDGVDTTDKNDLPIIFDKLFNLVEQWQQELMDCLEKCDHDDNELLSLNEHVTNSCCELIVYFLTNNFTKIYRNL